MFYLKRRIQRFLKEQTPLTDIRGDPALSWLSDFLNNQLNFIDLMGKVAMFHIINLYHLFIRIIKTVLRQYEYIWDGVVNLFGEYRMQGYVIVF